MFAAGLAECPAYRARWGTGGESREGRLALKRVAAVVAVVVVSSCAAPLAATAQEQTRKPNLRVSKLSSPPAAAKAGDSFDVSGKVANKGPKRGNTRLRLTLRTEAGADPVAQLHSLKVRVAPERAKRFATTVQVPAEAGAPAATEDEGIPAGEYVLVACVHRFGKLGAERCRAANDRMTIEPQPVTPPEPPAPNFTPGARSLGDPLLPQIGNGGYDATHYDIELDYDRPSNMFEDATVTMTARATQDLSEFSLDFQDLAVDGVSVDGVAAAFDQDDAKPDISADPAVTQPMKLVVVPPGGIVKGEDFTVEIDYHGEPQVFTDPDLSIEGWIPGCFTPSGAPVATCNSNFVVGEPMGSQAWFPSNNHPSDKATFDTSITVQLGDEAFGVGELVAPPVNNGDGTITWNWTEDDPTATYLATATNGNFDLDETTATETLTGRTLPVWNAIDPSANAEQRNGFETLVGRNSALLDFFGERFGPYPFDSYGAIYDRTTGIGYALEVQTKAHFSSLPSVFQQGTILGSNAFTYAHELAHMWFGNSVTLRNWNDIWFNEGWAQLAEWEYGHEFAGDPLTPAEQFDELYADPSFDWSVAPAVLGGDPANLFLNDPTYARGGMTLQAYREILGDDALFFAFAKQIQQRFRYGNISTARFIDLAEEHADFDDARAELLEEFFEQWLYGTTRPTITADDFQP